MFLDMVSLFQNILIVLIAFSGLFFGRLLVFIAPEELKPGRNWFNLLASMFFGALILLSYNISLFRIMAALLGSGIVLFFSKSFGRDKFMKKSFIIVIGFISGVIHYFSTSAFVSGSLAFLFFMMFSVMMYFPAKKDVDERKGIVRHKFNYIKEIMLPMSTFFISILLLILF